MQPLDGKEGTTMKRMRGFVGAAGIAVVTSLTGVAVAQQPSSPPPGAGGKPTDSQTASPTGSPTGSPTAGEPTTVSGEVMSTTQTVQKVDLKKRELSLKDDAGDQIMVQVPEDVSRLDAVKKGDKITLTYKQSLALSLKKGGKAATPSELSMAERKPGELPGGAVGRQITASAKVTKVDPEKNKLTIRTPDGKTDTINVSNPDLQSDLKQIKVGDRIQATYTEAVAMSVTPKNKG